ncbi:hypothetical protein FB565_007103 [Actinoplanes lutulentus]|nr:hypothetical protein [Actinoplanes lutulentus]
MYDLRVPDTRHQRVRDHVEHARLTAAAVNGDALAAAGIGVDVPELRVEQDPGEALHGIGERGAYPRICGVEKASTSSLDSDSDAQT